MVVHENVFNSLGAGAQNGAIGRGHQEMKKFREGGGHKALREWLGAELDKER
jgi:hypothetical protein